MLKKAMADGTACKKANRQAFVLQAKMIPTASERENVKWRQSGKHR